MKTTHDVTRSVAYNQQIQHHHHRIIIQKLMAKARPGIAIQRQRILDAARTLLAQTEISDLKANHIAKKADVSRATFYRCFSSVDDVVETLYLEFLEFVVQRLNDQLSVVKNTEQWLDVLVNDVIEHAIDTGPQLLTLHREELRSNSPSQIHLEQRVERQVDLISQFWQEKHGSVDKRLVRMCVLILQVCGLYAANATQYREDMIFAAKYTIEAMILRYQSESTSS